METMGQGAYLYMDFAARGLLVLRSLTPFVERDFRLRQLRSHVQIVCWLATSHTPLFMTSTADYEDSTHCAVRSAFIHLISAHLIRSNRFEPSACTVSVDPHSHFLTHAREEFKTCH
jgi:hypothetical protein